MSFPHSPELDLSQLWAALAAVGQCTEAIIVAATALFLVVQAKRLREESASHRVEAVSWATSYLNSDRFKANYDLFMLAPSGTKGQVTTGLNALALILADYDLVDDFVQHGFIDRETVYKLNAPKMESIANAIDLLLARKDSKDHTQRVLSYRASALDLVQGSITWLGAIRMQAKARLTS